MKNTIEWHEKCLKNRIAFASSQRRQIIRLQEELERNDRENEFYAAQIYLAKQDGKDGFDEDRYAIKRVTKALG